MSSRGIRTLRKPPSEKPVRNGSSRSTDAPKRGVGRNKSLPSGLRKAPGDVEDAAKRRQTRKEAPARGVNRVHSGGFALKGRKAASERAAAAGGGRMGSRSNLPPESPIRTPSGRKARKVTTPVSGIKPPIRGARAAGGETKNNSRARSRSNDKRVTPRRNNKEPEDANLSGRKGRRTASGSTPVPPAPSPMAKASPGGSGRKMRRTVPEKRGITASKSLPSEQIRKVERIRRGQDKKAPAFYTAPKRVPDEDTSSEEESSSSEEESSYSETSFEPTESNPDFVYDDYDSSIGMAAAPRNEESQDCLHYSGNFDFSDDDDISFGPAPQIGGKVVYSGGIVVEDASDSEHEFDHKAPSRNRRPDLKNGDDWLQPIPGTFQPLKNTSKATSTGSSRSSSKSGGKAATSKRSNKKSSGFKKVRTSDATKSRSRSSTKNGEKKKKSASRSTGARR